MTYSIGEVSQKIGLSTHTLRYYEKEGLLYSINRKSNGLREFTDNDIELLNVICCLKDTGMSINNIKHYINLCKQGKNSFADRKQIFEIQKKHIEKELEKLNTYLETAKFKIWYYENIEQLGNEDDPLNCGKMRTLYENNV